MNHKLDAMSNNFIEIINMLKENENEVSELKNTVKELTDLNVTLTENNRILINNNDVFKEKLESVNFRIDGIILDEENANRNGRALSLSDEDIEYIKQCRADGLSLRKIGEMMDVSHTTIANNLNRQTVNQQSNFTDSDDSQVTKSNADNINDFPENGKLDDLDFGEIDDINDDNSDSDLSNAKWY